VLYPYSYTCNAEPPTLEDLEELALGLAKAIRISRNGQAYKVSSACEGNVAVTKNPKDGSEERILLPRIESGGGSALDWFYHELRVKHAYQIKLRDTGSYGFLLPKENIVPTGTEVVDAVLYFGRYMLGEVGMMEDEAEEATQVNPFTRPRKEEDSHIVEPHNETVEDEAEDEDETNWELRRRRKH
jgi:extracellular matrix protein 14